MIEGEVCENCIYFRDDPPQRAIISKYYTGKGTCQRIPPSPEFCDEDVCRPAYKQPRVENDWTCPFFKPRY